MRNRERLCVCVNNVWEYDVWKGGKRREKERKKGKKRKKERKKERAHAKNVKMMFTLKSNSGERKDE